MRRAQALTLGAESLRRAYRLSHDRSNFDRMQEQIRAAFIELDTIQKLTRDNPSQQAIVKSLRPLVRARMDVVLDGIELHREAPSQADAVTVKDLQGRYLLVNPAVLRNFRRSEAEVLGKTDDELIPNETGRAIMAVDREIIASAAVRTFEQAVRIDDERQWTFLSTKGPYRNSAGEVAGIIAISRDITERKREEARVAAQNAERGEIIARLERQSAGLVAMAELAAKLHAAKGREETCQVIAEFAARLFGPRGELSLFDPAQDRMERAAHWGEEAGEFGTSVQIAAEGTVLGSLQLAGPVEGDQQHFLLAFTEQHRP